MSDSVRPITRHVLRDGDVSVTILSLGCITQEWRVPLGKRRVPVVLGYDDPDAYRDNRFFMGAVIGRVANRISNASFTHRGRIHRLCRNDSAHHLHGGAGGLHARIWTVEPDGARRVRLRHVSPDGDQGYPGRVVFTVTITLNGAQLRHDMQAVPDRATPINMTQHSYYNLMGGGSVLDHDLSIAADRMTPCDAEMIPTGARHCLDGDPRDLRRARPLCMADPSRDGLDLNYVLTRGNRAARLAAPNGLSLRLDTDQPCLQLFTAPRLGARARALAGQSHGPFSGVCLEPQGYPDAPNRPEFPESLATPDTPYRQRLDVTITEARS